MENLPFYCQVYCSDEGFLKQYRSTCDLTQFRSFGCKILFLLLFWCPCMAINVSVQYNGGFLPDIILLTQYYFHLGTRLNAMKKFCISSL